MVEFVSKLTTLRPDATTLQWSVGWPTVVEISPKLTIVRGCLTIVWSVWTGAMRHLVVAW